MSGVGQQLRAAREATGRSKAEMARRLQLREHVVAALEAEDYAALPAPAFVRGYIASYARAVGIAPEPMIEAYSNAIPRPPPTGEDTGTDAPAQSAPAHAVSDVPWLTITAATIFIIGYLVWEFSGPDPAADASIDSAPLTSVATGSTSGAIAPSTADVSPDRTAARGDAGSATDTASRAASAGPAGTEAAAAGTASRTEEAGATADPAAAAIAARRAADAGAAADSASLTAASETQAALDASGSAAAGAASNIGQLQVSVTEQTWVEVHDADGGRLYWDLANPGRDVSVSGKAPLRVLLGNADAVRVTMDGAQVNIDGFARSGMARFIIGPNSATPRAWPP